MWDFYIDQQKDELKDSIARNHFAEYTWSTEILKMEMFLKVLKLLKHTLTFHWLKFAPTHFMEKEME